MVHIKWENSLSLSPARFSSIHSPLLSRHLSRRRGNLLFAEPRLTFFARHHDKSRPGEVNIHIDFGLRDGELFRRELLWGGLRRHLTRKGTGYIGGISPPNSQASGGADAVQTQAREAGKAAWEEGRCGWNQAGKPREKGDWFGRRGRLGRERAIRSKAKSLPIKGDSPVQGQWSVRLVPAGKSRSVS